MAEFKAFLTNETEQQFQQFWSQVFEQSGAMTAKTGVVGAESLAVAQTATASGSVTIGQGMAVVQDTATNGAAPLVNPSMKTLDVLTANPMSGNPRNDIVVFDSAGSGTITTITGTPNASPTDPTIPATVVPLARLRMPGGTTAISTSMIEDLRVFTNLRRPRKWFKSVAPTASGNLVPGSTVNLGPTVTIPVNPFGPNVPYIVTVNAGCTAEAPAGATFFLGIELDGTVYAYPKNKNTGSGSGTVLANGTRSLAVGDPSTTHTVTVILQSLGSTVSVNSGTSQWLDMTVEPYTNF